ncbi:MAG: OmpA family protein [Actinomycetota bacterium]
MPTLLDKLIARLDEADVSSTLAARIGGDAAAVDAALGPAMARVIDGLARLAADRHGALVVGSLVDQHPDRPHPTSSAALVRLAETGDPGPGNVILDRVFGAERGLVVIGLASSLGLAPSLVGRLLPLVAPMVTAELANRRRVGSLDDGRVADLLAVDRARIAAAGILAGTSFADSGLGVARPQAERPAGRRRTVRKGGDPTTASLATIAVTQPLPVVVSTDRHDDPPPAPADRTADPDRADEAPPDEAPIDEAPLDEASFDGSPVDAASLDAPTAETATIDRATPDTVLVDPGSLDAATLDPGSLDAATLDAATPDTATVDRGSLDAATLDPGSLDAATLDVAMPDTTTVDLATPETASVDRGSVDTATIDVATPDPATLDRATVDTELVETASDESPVAAARSAEPIETEHTPEAGDVAGSLLDGIEVSSGPDALARATSAPAVVARATSAPAVVARATSDPAAARFAEVAPIDAPPATVTTVEPAPASHPVDARGTALAWLGWAVGSVVLVLLLALLLSTCAGGRVEPGEAPAVVGLGPAAGESAAGPDAVDPAGPTTTAGVESSVSAAGDLAPVPDVAASVAATLIGTGIEGLADGGHVVLTGSVADEEARADLEDRIGTLLGVESIDNQIAVVPPVVDPSTDGLIAPGPGPDPVSTPDLPAGSTLNDALDLAPIAFASKSAELTDEGRAIVDRVARYLHRHPELSISIDGHTDADGEAEANLELSQQRADAVLARLLELSVEPERVVAVGHGEAFPAHPNDSLDNKAANRRIEFTVR